MPRRYVPKRGDAVWLHFTPQAGREPAGRRPAVVLSPESYNQNASLALLLWHTRLPFQEGEHSVQRVGIVTQ